MKALFLFLILFGQRFQADDPVRYDNDAAVPVEKVTRHKLNDEYDFIQHTFGKQGDRTKGPAANINTLGEVPDSSWFQNRHGMHPMSLDALVQGPNSTEGPSTDGPWRVIEAKNEGITPGFRIRDARGDVYVIKFDPLTNPELATAAEVISTKFFHAIGFNVPENHLAFFTRQQLRPDKKGSITERDIEEILARVHRSPDGTYRALASRLLPGTPAGPFQYFGTRPDDPNDIFPHENRRELRGLRVFASWLNHDDSRAINTLDMVVEEDGRRYVKHYLIDFGSTLGSASVGPQKPRAGWEYMWEPKAALGRVFSLGLWDREWVRARYPEHSSVGRFESGLFKPEEWKPEYPNPAFDNVTDQDGYWAAKIVMSFTDEQIAAIVKSGQLSDRQAESYLTKTLIERRNKIGKYWLTRLSSFDQFVFEDGELSFDHLASSYGFASKPESRIAWFEFNNDRNHLRRIDDDRRFRDIAYFAAVISSGDGKVEVYIRNGENPEIVGIERFPLVRGEQ
jgi:hypothetical protein